ncbi:MULTISPECIES: hypothetical protein [Rufibacter]|nr:MULTISPECIES: hypothetical protein [Rufibacter]
MGTFYAEVWLLEHCGSIGMIRTFTSQAQLEPYLKTSSMEKLVQELLP